MKIALGVSGGIAAYKAAEIVRLLQDRGIHVQVVMTRAAQEFVRPLTFAALSGEKVITGMFGTDESQANVESAIEHIAIAQDEIKAGKVKWLIPEMPKLPVVAASENLNKVFAEDA